MGEGSFIAPFSLLKKFHKKNYAFCIKFLDF
nr:MAG TPA: protein of unknown function DUF601 [Caudoviricetes sp.]